jgi:hypothetical protein
MSFVSMPLHCRPHSLSKARSGFRTSLGGFERDHLYYETFQDKLCGQPHFTIGGWYDDDLIRTADGWHIVHRTGTAVWFDGNPKVLEYDTESGAPPRVLGHAAPEWLTTR